MSGGDSLGSAGFRPHTGHPQDKTEIQEFFNPERAGSRAAGPGTRCGVRVRGAMAGGGRRASTRVWAARAALGEDDLARRHNNDVTKFLCVACTCNGPSLTHCCICVHVHRAPPGAGAESMCISGRVLRRHELYLGGAEGQGRDLGWSCSWMCPTHEVRKQV